MLTILCFAVDHWFFPLPFGFATLPSWHKPRRQVVSPITHYQLPITNYQLPITYYLLPAFTDMISLQTDMI
ncbi:hypothetical protein [Fischerella thermalis]|uniref:hypothetical protein n=1 Tax=Fischerella thermalis TaxID=372787 RepID=UPI00307F801B